MMSHELEKRKTFLLSPPTLIIRGSITDFGKVSAFLQTFRFNFKNFQKVAIFRNESLTNHSLED